jgi:hypothetical protein
MKTRQVHSTSYLEFRCQNVYDDEGICDASTWKVQYWQEKYNDDAWDFFHDDLYDDQTIKQFWSFICISIR